MAIVLVADVYAGVRIGVQWKYLPVYLVHTGPFIALVAISAAVAIYGIVVLIHFLRGEEPAAANEEDHAADLGNLVP